jgi:uncharacterized protein YidB (DUF937 family)
MSLFDQISGALGGEHAGLLGSVLEVVGKEQGGGLAGLVQAFQQNGLGDVVASWIGTGQNQPITAGQIQAVLGSDAVKQIAAKMGLPPDAVSAKLAEVLPGAIDRLTPNGQLPEGGLLGQALSALRSRVS